MSAPRATAESLIGSGLALGDLESEPIGAAQARQRPVAIEDDDDAGGERFTDHVNATHAQDHAAGALRHADEMGDKWMRAGPVKWGIDFRGVVKPYAQKVAQQYFMGADDQGEVLDPVEQERTRRKEIVR